MWSNMIRDSFFFLTFVGMKSSFSWKFNWNSLFFSFLPYLKFDCFIIPTLLVQKIIEMRCTLVCYLLLQDAGGGEHDFKKLKKKKEKNLINMVGYYKRLIILFFFFLSIIYCLQFNMFKQSCRRGSVQARNSPSCNQKGSIHQFL
jgi:hypothetical protein